MSGGKFLSLENITDFCHLLVAMKEAGKMDTVRRHLEQENRMTDSKILLLRDHGND